MSEPPTLDPLSDEALACAVRVSKASTDLQWDVVSLPAPVYAAVERIADADGTTVDALVDGEMRQLVLRRPGTLRTLGHPRKRDRQPVHPFVDADDDSRPCPLGAEDLVGTLALRDEGALVLMKLGQPRAVIVPAAEFRRLKTLAGEDIPAAAMPELRRACQRITEARPRTTDTRTHLTRPRRLLSSACLVRLQAHRRRSASALGRLPRMATSCARRASCRVCRASAEPACSGTRWTPNSKRAKASTRSWRGILHWNETTSRLYVAAISRLDVYNKDAERFAAWLDSLGTNDEPEK